MKIIINILLLSFLIFPLFASEKKGVGVYNADFAQRVNVLNVGWYYSWKPSPLNGVINARFIPLIWGGNRYEEQLKFLQDANSSDILLGFNEPDNQKQSFMNVEEALDKWRVIQSLTKLIGSPAVINPYGKWFKQFYAEVKRQGLKMDFLAIHWYGPPDIHSFLNELDALHAQYGKPIWITEFAVADWDSNKHGKNRYSEEEVLEFMKKVLPELEKRDYIVRYAWYGVGNTEAVWTSRLFEKDGTLTELGCYYAYFGVKNYDDITSLQCKKYSNPFTNNEKVVNQ
jgi:hypothetical protein